VSDVSHPVGEQEYKWIFEPKVFLLLLFSIYSVDVAG